MKLPSLDKREKIVVGSGIFVLLLLLVWFALLTPYLNSVNRLERKISGQQNGLEKALLMHAQINALRQQLSKANTTSRREKRPLFSRVENLAEQTGVRDQLFSMRPQPAVIQGKYKQQLVDIRFKQITLSQLVRLLHAVEYRSSGVQVKTMRIKPRFEDHSLLGVNMVLMSLEKL